MRSAWLAAEATRREAMARDQRAEGVTRHSPVPGDRHHLFLPERPWSFSPLDGPVVKRTVASAAKKSENKVLASAQFMPQGASPPHADPVSLQLRPAAGDRPSQGRLDG